MSEIEGAERRFRDGFLRLALGIGGLGAVGTALCLLYRTIAKEGFIDASSAINILGLALATGVLLWAAVRLTGWIVAGFRFGGRPAAP